MKSCTMLRHDAHVSVGALLEVDMLKECTPLCREGFVAVSANDGQLGTFDEDLQRSFSRGKRSTRDIFIKTYQRCWEVTALSREGLHFGASDLQVC